MFLLYFFLIRRPPPKSTLFPYTTSSDLGSFNFDPRSAKLNTELGFIIESPKMAMDIETSFDEDIPNSAYEVLLSDEDSVYWLERKDGQAIRHDSEPETGFFKRGFVWLLSTLPIEFML